MMATPPSDETKALCGATATPDKTRETSTEADATSKQPDITENQSGFDATCHQEGAASLQCGAESSQNGGAPSQAKAAPSATGPVPTEAKHSGSSSEIPVDPDALMRWAVEKLVETRKDVGEIKLLLKHESNFMDLDHAEIKRHSERYPPELPPNARQIFCDLVWPTEQRQSHIVGKFMRKAFTGNKANFSIQLTTRDGRPIAFRAGQVVTDKVKSETARAAEEVYSSLANFDVAGTSLDSMCVLAQTKRRKEVVILPTEFPHISIFHKVIMQILSALVLSSFQHLTLPAWSRGKPI